LLLSVVKSHLTLAVSDLELGADHSAQALYRQVNASLETAIAAGELAPRDQALVIEMWNRLYAEAEKH